MTWPAFSRMSSMTFPTGVKPRVGCAARVASSPSAFGWRSRASEAGQLSKKRRFGAYQVRKMNLNVSNMYGRQGWDFVELHGRKKKWPPALG